MNQEQISIPQQPLYQQEKSHAQESVDRGSSQAERVLTESASVPVRVLQQSQKKSRRNEKPTQSDNVSHRALQGEKLPSYAPHPMTDEERREHRRLLINASKQRMRGKARSEGLCPDCRTPLVDDDHVLCAECRAKQKQRSRIYTKPEPLIQKPVESEHMTLLRIARFTAMSRAEWRRADELDAEIKALHSKSEIAND